MLKAIITHLGEVYGFHYLNEKSNKEYYVPVEDVLNPKSFEKFNVVYNGVDWSCTDCNINEIPQITFSEFFVVENGIVKSFSDIGKRYLTIGCTSVILPEKVNGQTVLELGKGCFRGREIENIVLPNSLIRINEEAFAYSDIINIIIPDNCIKIGESAFVESSLESIVFGKRLKVIGDYAFYDCYSLSGTDIILPASLEDVGADIFGAIEDLNFICKFVEGSIYTGSNSEDEFEDYDEEDDDFEEEFEDTIFGAYNSSIKYI